MLCPPQILHPRPTHIKPLGPASCENATAPPVALCPPGLRHVPARASWTTVKLYERTETRDLVYRVAVELVRLVASGETTITGLLESMGCSAAAV